MSYEISLSLSLSLSLGNLRILEGFPEDSIQGYCLYIYIYYKNNDKTYVHINAVWIVNGKILMILGCPSKNVILISWAFSRRVY